MAGACSELTHVILSHIRLLLDRVQAAFADDYRRFYLRHNDPVYVKLVKIDILQDVATAENAVAIGASWF